MATTQNSGGDSGTGGSVCARDFILDRLREADSPMSPAELADEYGCTNGHVRNTLADLRGQDRVKRVERGKYVDSESGSELPDVDIEAEMPPDTEGNAESEARDSDEEVDADPSADGGRPSPGTAIAVEAGREDSETMPSDEEYQRQRDERHDGSESDESGEQEASEEDAAEDKLDVEAVEEVGEESAGVPIPVSSTKLVGGAVLFLVVALWLSSSGSTGQAGETGQDQATQESQTAGSSGGGLIGGD